MLKKKKIIHFQVPLHDGKYILPVEIMEKFLSKMEEKIGKDYDIICSPFIPSTIQPNKNFVNFDAKQLILEDFNKLLGNK